MSHRDVTLYIDDIKLALKNIADYVADLSFDDFKNDSKTVDAVIRNFEIMGEAAAKIPPEFKEKHALIPWDKMMGIRNKMITNHFAISAKMLVHVNSFFASGTP